MRRWWLGALLGVAATAAHAQELVETFKKR